MLLTLPIRSALRWMSAAALLAAPAAAQVPLSGNVYDGNGGPLLSGTVYVATSSLTLPAGQTLTVQPGAIVKFVPAGSQLLVHGTLDVQGAAGSPAIFTAYADDAAGGDTNANGPSSGTPGHWRGIFFYATSSASTLRRAEVRYGGSSGYGGIDFQGAAGILLEDCAVRDCAADGIDFNGHKALASVVRCDVTGCATALDSLHVDTLPGLLDNTASGNALDVVRVTGGTPSTSLSIGPRNGIGDVVVLATSVDLNAGLSLTLDAGLILKQAVSGGQVLVRGDLIANGTSVEPVVFTAFADDAHGGDTNKDGPSTGTPGHWRGLFFYATSTASVLDHLVVRYGGSSGYGGIDFQGAAPVTLRDCAVEHCAAAGIDLNGHPAAVTVRDCSVQGCAIAIQAVHVDSLAGFLDNVASGNGLDVLRVTSGTPTTNLTVGPRNGVGDVVVLATSVVLNAGRTLTLEAGLILKVQVTGGQILAQGDLVANGTSAAPVVLTAFADDAFGGDSNGDGASAGTPGFWRGVFLSASSTATVLDHVVLRYGGSSGYGGIDFQGAAPATLRDCTVQHCAAAGVDLNGHAAPATVSGCAVEGCDTAYEAVHVDSLPGFSANTATGNQEDLLRITNFTPSQDVAIAPQSHVNGALVLGTSGTIHQGVRMTLLPAVVLKSEVAGAQLVVHGALDVPASMEHPAVLTVLEDDAFGGDTNGDGGASAPVPGRWRGIFLYSDTDASTIRGLRLRYTGSSGYPGLTASSPLASVREVRVDHGAADGVECDQLAGTGERWAAFQCAGRGVDLQGSGYDARQLTAVACGTGIQRATGFGGHVYDSIAWANTTNYAGFGAGQLSFSNGSAALAGQNGNTNVDPQLVDQAAGDLRLTMGSPCVDAGAVTSPLDPDGSRADMGAYPLDHCEPSVYCTAKTTSFPNCVPALTWSGKPSASQASGFVVTCAPVPAGQVGVFFYGQSGPFAQPFQGGTLCVKPPVRRTPPHGSGGTALQCDGQLAVDFNAYRASGVDPALVQGSLVNIQGWFRDPGDPFGTGLSDALQFQICP